MDSITLGHIKRLRQTSGVEVEITRGEHLHSCFLIAVPSSSTAKVVGEDGSYTVVQVEDWIILRSDWTLYGPAEPQRGDKISVGGCSWLVNHPDENTPVFANFNPLDRPALAWVVHSMPR